MFFERFRYNSEKLSFNNRKYARKFVKRNNEMKVKLYSRDDYSVAALNRTQTEQTDENRASL